MAFSVTSYEKRLQGLVENIPGALSACLTGVDGIGIASYWGQPDIDTALADAEFATMMIAASRAAQNLGVGDIGELIFTTEQATYILRMVGRDYFLAVCLASSSSNLGMARLQMRWASEEFSQALL